MNCDHISLDDLYVLPVNTSLNNPLTDNINNINNINNLVDNQTDSSPDVVKTITIQTHDGKFHLDEVGAISLLTTYYNINKYKVHLIRSRDINPETNILVDVGGIYNPSELKFDHHQPNCSETFSDKHSIPMSSLGMVWKHFGKNILDMFIQTSVFSSSFSDSFNDNKKDKKKDELIKEIYDKLILEIDAHDNGIPMVE